MLKIFINGQQKLSQINNNAKEFQNVQFFSSDNWHTPADAEYRNLCFETEKEEEVEGNHDRRVRCMIALLFFQVVLLDLHILITPGSAINGFKIIPSIWPGVRQMRNASLWEVPWPQFMMRRPTTSLCLRCQQSPMLEDTRWMATGSGLMDLLGAIQTGILANLAVETFLRSSMVGDSQSGMQWRDLGE